MPTTSDGHGGIPDVHLTRFGQSGSRVSLHLEAGKTVIQKTAPEGGEVRLFAQFEKQRSFPTHLMIQIPKILGDWSGNSFQMEYVSSSTLGTFSQVASHTEWKAVADKIVAFLRLLVEQATESGESLSQHPGLRAKLEGLQRQITLPKDSVQAKAILRLELASELIPFRFGINHGDFSYENILIAKKDQKVWLVDFLDSPIETPLIDVGRLLIDCEHGWWFSSSPNSVSEEFAGNYLSQGIRVMTEELGITSEELNFFKVLAALRVLPYTTAPIRRSKLLSIIA